MSNDEIRRIGEDAIGNNATVFQLADECLRRGNEIIGLRDENKHLKKYIAELEMKMACGEYTP